jgi:hypothetical protein
MMKFHSAYITKQLRSTTKAQLLEDVSGYNQGYDSDSATYYRRIPADILAKIHEVEVEMHRLHDRKLLLLKSGWQKGRMPADITKLMDRKKHDANHMALIAAKPGRAS